jgi:DNA-binding CsgD family transcriptional regulator
LTLGHVRSVFRLVGEVGESGAGWRAHYLAGAARLTGAQVGLGADTVRAGGGLRFDNLTDVGWATASDRRIYQEYMAAGGYAGEPSFPLIVADPTAAWTRTRRRLVADRVYYRSDSYHVRREGHTGEYLHSCRFWPTDGVSCGVQLCRTFGERPFGPVEVKLIHLVQAELARDRETRLARQREERSAGLSRRERQVLELLLAGHSEKRVAGELGISPHTAHQYVKALYAHFGVHSRAELLAHFLRRTDRG